MNKKYQPIGQGSDDQPSRLPGTVLGRGWWANLAQSTGQDGGGARPCRPAWGERLLSPQGSREPLSLWV